MAMKEAGRAPAAAPPQAAGKETAQGWADEVAARVLARKKARYTCAGMWTPSGRFHIGNARAEIFTPYAVRHALETRSVHVRQVFVVDDFDAVRKIPEGLGVKESERHRFLGYPCATAPSPVPGHRSWAACFASEVAETVQAYGVELEMQSAYEEYRKGRLNAFILESLEKAARIADTWSRVAGADKPASFIPVQVVCEACKKIQTTRARAWDGKKVAYTCTCGREGRLRPLDGNAKLHWRVHWVAFWRLNEVDFESGGKDHFSRGGSVDVGRALAREVFGFEPPVQVMTEFIQLRGKKMSGSVGNVIGLGEWLDIAGPETFRYLNFSYRPGKAIEIDLASRAFLGVMEQFERAERVYYGEEEAQNKKLTEKIRRNYALACLQPPPPRRPLSIPFSHALLLGQLFDPEKAWPAIEHALRRTGHVRGRLSSADAARLREKIARARRWAHRYAPPELRLAFPKRVDTAYYQALEPAVKDALKAMARAVKDAGDAEALQQRLAALARARADPRKVFAAFYTLLTGKPRGPRAATLALALGKEKVASRLRGH